MKKPATSSNTFHPSVLWNKQEGHSNNQNTRWSIRGTQQLRIIREIPHWLFLRKVKHTSSGVGRTLEAAARPALWTWCQRPRYHTAGCSHRSSPLLLLLEPSYAKAGQEFSYESPKRSMKGWLARLPWSENTNNGIGNGNNFRSGNRSERSLALPEMNWFWDN